VQLRRPHARVIGSAIVVVALVATVAATTQADFEGPGSSALPEASLVALRVEGAIERCASARPAGGYRGGDGEDCLAYSSGAVVGTGEALHVTPLAAGRGYVVQVGSDEHGWFIVVRDSAGRRSRLCARRPLASLEPDTGATFPGCDAGRWANPRETTR
jgi:hypothetical protein